MSKTNLSFSSIEEIIQAIQVELRTDNDTPVLVGIDGGGGSGKSTLASALADAFDDATVVHIDDFADWTDDANFDVSTFAERVIEPLLAGIVSKHQRYDWSTDTFGDWFEVSPGKLTIVEGVTALRSQLRKYWNVSIWVECPREIRLERGIARDGEAIRSKWVDLWMPGEDEYFEREKPQEAAGVMFDGSS